jgi:hypothetical protein
MKRFPLLHLLVFVLCPALCLGQVAASKRERLSPEKWFKLRDGDIVFIRSRTKNAPLIAALSNLDAKSDVDDVFTHCGIIFKVGDVPKVYEGEGRGVGVWYPLAKWQSEESKGVVDGQAKSDLHNVYVMRWNGQPALSTGLVRLLAKAKALHDTQYDYGFFWTDTRAYCSELVWRAYEEGGLKLLGKLPTMGDYVKAAATPVAEKVLQKLNDKDTKKKYRNGRGYEEGESAISPEDIYRSPFLIAVTDNSP